MCVALLALTFNQVPQVKGQDPVILSNNNGNFTYYGNYTSTDVAAVEDVCGKNISWVDIGEQEFMGTPQSVPFKPAKINILNFPYPSSDPVTYSCPNGYDGCDSGGFKISSQENFEEEGQYNITVVLKDPRAKDFVGYYMTVENEEGVGEDRSPLFCPFRSYVAPINTSCFTQYNDGDDFLFVTCYTCYGLPYIECRANGTLFDFAPAPAKCKKKVVDTGALSEFKMESMYPSACAGIIKISALEGPEILLQIRPGKPVPEDVAPWKDFVTTITVPEVRFAKSCLKRSSYTKSGDVFQAQCLCYISEPRKGDYVQWFVDGEKVGELDESGFSTITVEMIVEYDKRKTFSCQGFGAVTQKLPDFVVPNIEVLNLPYDDAPVVSLVEGTCKKTTTPGEVSQCVCRLDQPGNPPGIPTWFNPVGIRLITGSDKADDSSSIDVSENESTQSKLVFITKAESADTRVFTCRAVTDSDTTAPSNIIKYSVKKINSPLYDSTSKTGIILYVLLVVVLVLIIVYTVATYFVCLKITVKDNAH